MDDDFIDQDELDVRYRELVDSFIDQANDLSDNNSIENVGMAILFAASRFNAYVVSQHAQSKDAYVSDLPKARDFFRKQYRQMLDENLEDYQSVFEKYSKFTKPN